MLRPRFAGVVTMPLPARIMVLSFLLLAATCGQKGPLTPPDAEALAETRTATNHEPIARS